MLVGLLGLVIFLPGEYFKGALSVGFFFLVLPFIVIRDEWSIAPLEALPYIAPLLFITVGLFLLVKSKNSAMRLVYATTMAFVWALFAIYCGSHASP